QSLTRVDRLISDGGVLTQTYSYTPTSFESYQDGERELRFDLFSPTPGIDGGVLTDTSGNSGGGTVWNFIWPVGNLVCNPDGGQCEKYSSGSFFSGEGRQSAVTATQEYRLGNYSVLPEHVGISTLQCTTGTCAGVSTVNRSWSITQVSVGQPIGSAVPID